jgi:hypothetical protein
LEQVFGKCHDTDAQAVAYLWPMPPATISDESKAAFDADLKAKGSFGVLDDSNRRRVHVRTRHRDNLARGENREYLCSSAQQFAARWACLDLGACGLAMLVQGYFWIEVPMTLIGAAAAFVAMAFWYAHRNLNATWR